MGLAQGRHRAGIAGGRIVGAWTSRRQRASPPRRANGPMSAGSDRAGPRRGHPRLQRRGRPRAGVRAARRFLDTQFPYPVRITIADNASTDGTADIARRLADELAGVAAGRTSTRRAAAARCSTAWLGSDAAVLAYMDVDLSTDLAALLPLVAPLISGHSDLAIGTRLARTLAGGPRRQARVHLAQLQPAAARRAARTGSPTPSAASRRSGPTSPSGCCRWSRTPAGSSTPSCWCSPSAPGCASTRCRSTGSTTRTAASTSSRPRRPTCAASPGCGRALAAGRHPGRRAARAARPPAADAAARRRPPELCSGSSSGSRVVGVRLARSPTPLLYLAAAPVRSARRPPTSSRCWSPRSPTPRPTAAFTFGVRGRGGAARHQVQGLVVFGLGLALTSGSLALAARRRARRRPGPSSSPCSSSPTSCATVAALRRSSAAGCSAPRARRSPHAVPQTGVPRPMTDARPSRPPPRARPDGPAPPPRPRRRRSARLVAARGRATAPRWVRPALLGLLARHRGCSTSGTSARPAGPTPSTRRPCRPGRRAGRRSSSAPPTPRNSITVDKPPGLAVGHGAVGAALRAVLVVASWCPQALMGVATVGVLYAERAAPVPAPAPACSPARCSR